MPRATYGARARGHAHAATRTRGAWARRQAGTRALAQSIIVNFGSQSHGGVVQL